MQKRDREIEDKAGHHRSQMEPGSGRLQSGLMLSGGKELEDSTEHRKLNASVISDASSIFNNQVIASARNQPREGLEDTDLRHFVEANIPVAGLGTDLQRTAE